jgi:hypothetical protein
MTACPHCAAEISSGVFSCQTGEPRSAQTNVIGVCIECAGIIGFGSDLNIVALSESDLTGFFPGIRFGVRRLQRLVLEYRAANPRPV